MFNWVIQASKSKSSLILGPVWLLIRFKFHDLGLALM